MRFVPICLAKAARLVSHEGGGRCRSRGHGIEKDRIESSLRGSGNIFVWIRPDSLLYYQELWANKAYYAVDTRILIITVTALDNLL